MIDLETGGAWAWLGLATSIGVMGSAVVADVRSGKIPNKLTYPAAVAGLVLHLGAAIASPDQPWWFGLRESLAGFGLGFFVLFLGYMFGGIGGGDVKACAALGALVGLNTTIYGLLYMGLAGGAMALSIMIWKGKLFRSLRNMGRFFFTALIPGLETEMPKEENSDPFPLGVAISLGFAWALIEQGWFHSQPIIDLGL